MPVDKETLTTNAGAPLPSNEHTLTAGQNGPALLQDYFLIEKLAHFDRERIPERVVHAKGAGAFGTFTCTHDMSNHTRAHVFGAVGRKTRVLARFSTVGGERGSADAERDPRGFAVKFYTEDGNYDIVGNNTPVFFLRDPFKFPDLVHTHKRHPQTNLKDKEAYWDFFAASPESTHQVTVLFSDRGIPANYRQMHGFGCHTFKWVTASGEACWVKYHFKSEQGIANLHGEKLQGTLAGDPDHATRDLYQHIEQRKFPAWKLCVQVMTEEQARSYHVDPFDVTKTWSQKDFPLQEVGRMELHENPQNFFAQVEQVAYSPSNFVPGIEPSPDKLLHGRIFSYPDTQRHRLGANYQLLPVNCPYSHKLNNYQRDGAMRTDDNGGSRPNYSPNSYGGPKADARAMEAPVQTDGPGRRTDVDQTGRDDDFVQAGVLWRLLPADEQERLVQALKGHLGGASRQVQQRQVEHFRRADASYGERVSQALGL